MSAGTLAHLTLSAPPDPAQRVRGEHWKDDTGTSFRNPWPSAKGQPAFSDILKFMWHGSSAEKKAEFQDTSFIKRATPDFNSPPAGTVKAVWLGHACTVISFPALPGEERGLNILCDAVFSDRCGPTQLFGAPRRFTPVPCGNVNGLPEIDIVVLSHNHYDHLDLPTLKALYTKQAARPPAMLLPLNTTRLLGSVRIPPEIIRELDWWEEATVEVANRGTIRFTCTPAQHMTARTPFDTAASLWASWAIQEVNKAGDVGASVWFGGDTGYSQVESETYEIDPALPVCPEFKKIGERFGSFSLALIPIGAYSSRVFLSTVHCAPIDSVRVFQDVRAKKAMAIHWGTWDLSWENLSDPPRQLIEARKVVGLTQEQFDICALGGCVVAEA